MSATDENELRLRVQGAFSAGEMRALFGRWGLGEAGGDDAGVLARQLIRGGLRRFGAKELLRRLRTERPLVEWPEAGEDDPSWAGGVPDLVGDGAGDPGPDVEAAAPAGAGGVAPTVVDPPPSAAAARPAAASTRSTSPYATPPAPEPARTGVDPRLFVGVAGLMVVLAGVAFAAGLAWRADDGAAAPAASASAGAPRSRGPAGRMADLFDDGLLGVAKRCAVDIEGASGPEVLALAQEDCGEAITTGGARRRRGEPPLPPLPDEPVRPTPPEPTAVAVVRPQGGGAPVKSGCLASCQSQRSSCNGACGAEPSDAAQYGAYQACKSKCLSVESRCRLGCN